MGKSSGDSSAVNMLVIKVKHGYPYPPYVL